MQVEIHFGQGGLCAASVVAFKYQLIFTFNSFFYPFSHGLLKPQQLKILLVGSKYEGPLKISFLGNPVVGENQQAEREKKERAKVSVNNDQVNCLDQFVVQCYLQR